MEPTAALARRQRTYLQRHRDRCNTASFLNLLGRDDLLETLDTMLPEHRRRLFPPLETPAMFLSQAMSDDGSCQQVLDECIARRVATDLPVPSASTSAFCQARRRLPTERLTASCRCVGRSLSDAAERGWRWCGRRAVLIDGTTVSMPDTVSNQRVYPQSSSQESGLGFPRARLVGLSCLATGALLDLAISPCAGKGSDEPSRQRLLMSELEAGDVLVGDSNFESYCAIAALRARGVEVVFEAGSGRKLARRGTLVTLRRPKTRPVWMDPHDFAEVPATLRLRRVRAGRRGEQKKTLLTTMIDTRAVSNRQIAELYRRRWEIEICQPWCLCITVRVGVERRPSAASVRLRAGAAVARSRPSWPSQARSGASPCRRVVPGDVPSAAIGTPSVAACPARVPAR